MRFELENMCYGIFSKQESQLKRAICTGIMVNKDLIIFPGAVGDFVCFLPALRSLSRDRKVELFARTEYGELLPSLVTTRSLECDQISRLFAAGAATNQRLITFFSPYSRIWSWMGSNEPKFVANLSAVCKGRLRIFPFRPLGRDMHLADYYLSCIDDKENYSKQTSPMIPLKPEALAWSHGFCRENQLEGKNILAVAPGSGAKEKNWAVGYYKNIAEWWQRELNGKVVIILGPVEEENKDLVESTRTMLTARGLTLGQLAALLRRCRLYLGNDSGVTHLAASVGVPTLAIFGPTDPIEWAPRGHRVVVINQRVECSPCVIPMMKGCPHRKCLTTLSSAQVVKVVEKSLKKFQGFEA